MSSNENKSLWSMDTAELQNEWVKTFFSKRILVAAPVALAVGVPIAAVAAPVAGAAAGMVAGITAARHVFKKKSGDKTKTNEKKQA